ncbi:MAG TPA: universal stress protein [Gaiellaceae bacterium]|nr:universal stress protein [Gaiellaceae bacterium]
MSGIVVGVDGSPGSKRALEWAAAEARVRQLPLTLVHAWYPPFSAYGGIGWAGADAQAISSLEELANDRLAAIRDEASAALEGLEVETVVVEGLAARTLLDAAADADLLVVGTRGHGGFVGLLLGSVSQECAHHSRCPIVIVPSATPDKG